MLPTRKGQWTHSQVDFPNVNSVRQYVEPRTRNLPISDVERSNFPLPDLAAILDHAREEVRNGKGSFTISGLDPGRYSAKDRAIIFLGVSSHIAEERGPQGRYGTMLKHLTDDEQTEPTRDLPFHTDVICDVVASFAVSASDHGGASKIVRQALVYDTIATRLPEMVKTPSTPNWPFDTFGRDPPYYFRALVHLHYGKPIFNDSHRLLAGHPVNGRTAGVPKLSVSQGKALDALESVAMEHCERLEMRTGDLRFMNNRMLLHSREEFRDEDSMESKRHLMRLWLRDLDMCQDLPTGLGLALARVFDDGNRHPCLLRFSLHEVWRVVWSRPKD